MYFKSEALVKNGLIWTYNHTVITEFSLNISITERKCYNAGCFLEATFYEEYFLFVYILVIAIPKKALAIPRFVEKKNIFNKSYFLFILGHQSFALLGENIILVISDAITEQELKILF